MVLSKMIQPPILGELGEFLIKKTDIELKENAKIGMPYILTNNYNTLLDVYDKFDTRKSQKIKNVKISFFTYKHDNYLSTTHFYVKNEQGEIINRKVFLNNEIYKFISVDFSTHIRFFYQKNQAKYLDTKKVINVLSSNKEGAVLKANVFPYLQEEQTNKKNDLSTQQKENSKKQVKAKDNNDKGDNLYLPDLNKTFIKKYIQKALKILKEV